jgi:hypothetical protein
MALFFSLVAREINFVGRVAWGLQGRFGNIGVPLLPKYYARDCMLASKKVENFKVFLKFV